ncbi:hypothetical protein K525DRAFT_192646 [Schizophyllum commune Loenen D]|nr:hypothetical protein K525DRAFT_192646 [Schizophyllum commune Loenen D]
MTTFFDATECLRRVPSVIGWTWKQTTLFVRLCHRLEPQIYASGATAAATQELPDNISAFLAAVLGQDEDTIRLCWHAIRNILPELDSADGQEEDTLFRVHAPDHSVSTESLLPPSLVCTAHECRGRRLYAKHASVKARIFTLRRGVLPVFEQPLTCRGCNTIYYHNFCVKDPGSAASKRLYYGGVPKWIAAQKTTFFEKDLVLHFEAQMVHQRASAEGIAETYNAALGGRQAINRGTLDESLQGSHVYNAFFLHCLLRDKERRKEVLELPHTGLHADRLVNALHERNVRMQGVGQPQWAHSCDKCTSFFRDEHGHLRYVRAVVCDGVVMGHPCCSFGDVCRNPLENPKHRFCAAHRFKDTLCFMATCSKPRTPGRLACDDPDHQAEEEKVVADTSHSLENLRRRGLHSAAARVMGGEIIDSAPLDELPEVRRDGRRRQEYITRRRWTKFEFVTIFPCGVIVGRATMFRAEAESGVELILKGTFPPEFPGAKPSYIFYDRNCRFRRFLENKGDTYFVGDVGLVVDVFHLQHAHSRSDDYCGLYCNPANYPELINKEGDGWRFNSEVCEINFTWYGSYAAIVRDMTSYRYNFYLDEMVMLHNEKVVERLKAEGLRPHLIPEDALRQSFHPTTE